MLIYVKKIYKIYGDLVKDEKSDKFELTISTDNNSEIVITIFPSDQRIESRYQIDVSESLFQFLKNGEYKGIKILDDQLEKINNLDEKLEREFFLNISQMQSGLTDVTGRVYNYLKYFCNQKEIFALYPDDVTYWSNDGLIWNATISETKKNLGDYWSDVYPIYPLVKTEIQKLQKCLDLKIEPFLAFDFLFKAENNENDPRYMWIFTTIALEYAIKEFLIQRDTKLEVFLIDNQSPPAFKLYGKILDQIEGENVDLCLKPNDIRIASEVRNLLIHRPKKIMIELDDARTYVQLAGFTIGQLFSRLNPESPYSRNMSDIKSSYVFPKGKYEMILKESRKNR